MSCHTTALAAAPAKPRSTLPAPKLKFLHSLGAGGRGDFVRGENVDRPKSRTQQRLIAATPSLPSPLSSRADPRVKPRGGIGTLRGRGLVGLARTEICESDSTEKGGGSRCALARRRCVRCPEAGPFRARSDVSGAWDASEDQLRRARSGDRSAVSGESPRGAVFPGLPARPALQEPAPAARKDQAEARSAAPRPAEIPPVTVAGAEVPVRAWVAPAADWLADYGVFSSRRNAHLRGGFRAKRVAQWLSCPRPTIARQRCSG